MKEKMPIDFYGPVLTVFSPVPALPSAAFVLPIAVDEFYAGTEKQNNLLLEKILENGGVNGQRN